MSSPPRSILVIDDSELVRSLLRDVLGRRGHRVFLTDSAEEGIAMMERIHMDAAVTDFNLGGTNGIEVCRQLQRSAQRHGRTIPIVVISGSELRDLSKAAVEAGAIAFVRKPFNPAELCRLLESNFSTQVFSADAPKPSDAPTD